MDRPLNELSKSDVRITPVIPTSKTSKHKETFNPKWVQAITEAFRGAPVVPVESAPEIEVPEDSPDIVIDEEHVPRRGKRRKLIENEKDFDEIIERIQKMADEPEKLFESHLGVFTDPAPPGKMLNSKG